jgi:hypothetical protein
MNIHRGGKMKAVVVAGCCVFCTLCLFSRASADNYIGIILEGYQRDCIVQSRGEEYDCRESRQLYAGDKVIKKPDIKALKIKWAPYASGKELNKTSLLVIFEPPNDKKGIVQGVRDMLGLAKTGHTISVGATRGGADMVIPQPGNNATLISGQKSTFAWESEGGKYIVFKDSKGAEVFKKDLKGEPVLQLSPEEIGMKPGEAYTWNITGTRTNREFRVRVLPQDVAQQVTGDLREIEQEPIGTVEKVLRKAVYLQFMSDAYPQDIDLYWFSYRLLEGIKDERILKEDDKVLLSDLKRNYLRHVRDSM